MRPPIVREGADLASGRWKVSVGDSRLWGAAAGRYALLSALLLSLVGLLAACGVGDREATGETPVGATPTRPAGNAGLREAVPRGWTLTESASSEDDAYAVLVSTGRTRGAADSITVLSIYGQVDGA